MSYPCITRLESLTVKADSIALQPTLLFYLKTTIVNAFKIRSRLLGPGSALYLTQVKDR